jgi:hypothetical protein
MKGNQIAKRFVKNTDSDFKNEEFEKAFAAHMINFIQYYPHLIRKIPFKDNEEDWVFRFYVDEDEVII